MRGYLRTWERRSSAANRGESTFLRVKNPVVHSRSRLTVHGPATGVCMRGIVGGGTWSLKRPRQKCKQKSPGLIERKLGVVREDARGQRLAASGDPSFRSVQSRRTIWQTLSPPGIFHASQFFLAS